MGDNWTTGIHPGYRTKVIRVGNATIEIHRPLLADEERNKREDQVKEALKGFGKGVSK